MPTMRGDAAAGVELHCGNADIHMQHLAEYETIVS